VTFDPIPYARAEGLPPVLEKNRRGALIGFGVGSLIIGAVAGCGTVGMLFTFLMMFRMSGSLPQFPMLEFAVALCSYASAATLFIWVGVDSIRCKRWVRPVVIAVGWITVAWLGLGLAFMLATLKDQRALMGNMATTPATLPVTTPATTQATTQVSTAVSATTTTSTVTFTASSMGEAFVTYCVMLGVIFLFLLVAALYTWFYSKEDVRQTLAAYDPGPSWTERCPVPVFVACTGLLLFALGTVLTSATQVVPFFGVYVDGPLAALVDLAAVGLMLVAMVQMYRMKKSGPTLAAVVVGLGFLSAVITFWRLGMVEFYRRGQASPDELEQLAKSSTMTGAMPIAFVIVSGMLCVGYLVWVRRYFRGHAAPAAVS